MKNTRQTLRSMTSKSLFEQKKLWLESFRFRDRG